MFTILDLTSTSYQVCFFMPYKVLSRIAVALIILLQLVPVSLYAHPGLTDEKGGHTNRLTGEYHYHGIKGAYVKNTSSSSQTRPSVNTTSKKSSNRVRIWKDEDGVVHIGNKKDPRANSAI